MYWKTQCLASSSCCFWALDGIEGVYVIDQRPCIRMTCMERLSSVGWKSKQVSLAYFISTQWIENSYCSSVLDNKLLTPPNRECLNLLSSSIRIMFEVEHLKYATLVTVGRCGMILFSKDIVEPLRDISQLSFNSGICPAVIQQPRNPEADCVYPWALLHRR